MENLNRIQANGFYVFSGRANANSCFIEKISHAKKFLVYANHFLKGYLVIYDYIITRDGWTMVVKIKLDQKIKNNNSKSKDEVWRVISERMRLFLSTFVRVTNKQKGRTGCLVHSSYQRSFFLSLKEATSFLEKIRTQNIKHYAKKKKYRGLKTHYKISKKKGQGSVFLCSKEIRKVKKEISKSFEVIDFKGLTNLVLQKMINLTISLNEKGQPTD